MGEPEGPYKYDDDGAIAKERGDILLKDGVKFRVKGVTFDLFVSDSGAIGLTVVNKVGNWSDVFIDPETLQFTGDIEGCGPDTTTPEEATALIDAATNH